MRELKITVEMDIVRFLVLHVRPRYPIVTEKKETRDWQATVLLEATVGRPRSRIGYYAVRLFDGKGLPTDSDFEFLEPAGAIVDHIDPVMRSLFPMCHEFDVIHGCGNRMRKCLVAFLSQFSTCQSLFSQFDVQRNYSAAQIRELWGREPISIVPGVRNSIADYEAMRPRAGNNFRGNTLQSYDEEMQIDAATFASVLSQFLPEYADPPRQPPADRR